MSARNSLGTTGKPQKGSAPTQGGEKPDYSAMNLVDLRKNREKNVNDMNFEEVAIIDEAIKKYNVDNTAKVIEKVTKQLSQEIDQAFQRYEQSINQRTADSDEAEARIRNATNENFQLLKEKQKLELADVETEYQLNIIRSKVRPSAKNEEMKNIAKNLARSANIEAAINAREEAKMSLEQEIALRQYEIEQKYKRILAYTNKKITNELKAMQDNLQKQIQNNDLQREKDIVIRKQALKGYITEALRRAISDGCNELSRKDKRPELTQNLTDFVQQKLVSEEKAAVFQGLE